MDIRSPARVASIAVAVASGLASLTFIAGAVLADAPRQTPASETQWGRFEPLGTLSPGGKYRLVIDRFKRYGADRSAVYDDGESTLGPERSRRTTELSVDRECSPRALTMVEDLETGRAWFVISQDARGGAIDFRERPGTKRTGAPPPRVDALQVPAGGVCGKLAPRPEGFWKDRIEALGAQLVGGTVFEGVPSLLYVVNQVIDTADERDRWLASVGFRDIMDVVSVTQHIVLDPNADMVLANHTYAVEADGRSTLVESFEIKTAYCIPSCKY